MLTLRQRIFTIIGISSGLIVAIILGIMYIGPSDPNNEDTNTQTVDVVDTNNSQIIVIPQNDAVAAKPRASSEELYVKNLSKLFVERFFTYSNQNNNEHISEIQNLATPSMWQWIQTQAQTQDLTYTGVVTEVLSARVSSSTVETGEAVVAIEASQKMLVQNEAGLVDEQVTQKSADVHLKKIEGVWLVDGVWWE